MGAPFWTECHYQSFLWASEVSLVIDRDAPVEMVVGGLNGSWFPFVHSWAEVRLPQLVIYDSVAARYVSPEVYRREYGEPDVLARYSLREYMACALEYGHTGPFFEINHRYYLGRKQCPPLMGDQVDLDAWEYPDA